MIPFGYLYLSNGRPLKYVRTKPKNNWMACTANFLFHTMVALHTSRKGKFTDSFERPVPLNLMVLSIG